MAVFAVLFHDLNCLPAEEHAFVPFGEGVTRPFSGRDRRRNSTRTRNKLAIRRRLDNVQRYLLLSALYAIAAFDLARIMYVDVAVR